MNNKKIKHCIKIDLKTKKEIENISQYLNLRSKLKNEEKYTNEEDVIKAAISHYLNEITNFYKSIIIKEKYTIIPKINLKNRFKKIKDQKNLKQKDLEELTGIDKSSLSHILNNKYQPQMDHFLRLWIALDYPSIEEIFYYE